MLFELYHFRLRNPAIKRDKLAACRAKKLSYKF